jgi:hypothetical protein
MHVINNALNFSEQMKEKSRKIKSKERQVEKGIITNTSDI